MPRREPSTTLAMELGGHRFADYGKLGLRLSLIAIVLGAPLILIVWPPR